MPNIIMITGEHENQEAVEYLISYIYDSPYFRMGDMCIRDRCITLRGTYEVTSNLEAGYGRSDITLRALSAKGINVILEFKQGEDINHLKEEALQQILEQKYYTGLSGEVLCVGVAHDKKRCSVMHKVIFI